MDINKDLFEQKNKELALKLAAAEIEDRPYILEMLNEITSMQRIYDSLCARFEALFSAATMSVEIEITGGAISENYLNLRKALSQGLVLPETSVHITFPGLELEGFNGEIKANGYLRNRAVTRRFYELAGIRQEGRRVLFTKLGPNEYTLEALPATQESHTEIAVPYGRLTPFQFSQCHIAPGEILVYADDPTVICTVQDDKHVLYNNRSYSLSALAQQLRGTTASLAGPRYFTYKGELLSDLRKRIEGRI